MKAPLIRWLASLLAMAVVVSMAVWWRNLSYVGNPLGQVLGWPAIELARLGLRHTWLVIPLALLGLPAMWAVVFRHRQMAVAVLLTALTAAVICGVGVAWTRKLAKMKPANVPYPAGSSEAKAYLEAYGLGYVYGITGAMVTYCFRPEADTRGYYQGQEDGTVIFNRALGWPEEKSQSLIRRSAAID